MLHIVTLYFPLSNHATICRRQQRICLIGSCLITRHRPQRKLLRLPGAKITILLNLKQIEIITNLLIPGDNVELSIITICTLQYVRSRAYISQIATHTPVPRTTVIYHNMTMAHTLLRQIVLHRQVTALLVHAEPLYAVKRHATREG